ncbi:MAG TPA: hypothetical protein GXZ87_02775 [Bacteroidales bacterium]|nr:hypothetical protein [Bacteroidales bacterium]
MRNELQNILSGTSSYSYDAVIQTIARYLRRSERASPTAEEKHENKPKETAKLIEYAKKHNLFYEVLNEDDYISEGAEQKVFISGDDAVIKLNDAIYYASWKDYFHNLLLHNYFFSDTAYSFLGFYLKEDVLYAVVKQNFIKTEEQTDLANVRKFLVANGFENTKNHDYYHPVLGIILEDLHDENVLTNNGVLYFIDTVFYINSEVFWKDIE